MNMTKIGAIGVALVLATIALIPALFGSNPAGADPCSPGGDTIHADLPAQSVGRWSAKQVNNAARLMAVGTKMNVPARAQKLIVTAAIDESNLIPQGQQGGITNAGGRAYGILQQTPYESGGSWGTIDQVMDIEYAAKQFYDHLLEVPGWETMAPTVAIHAVQRNADPNVYAQFWDDGLALVDAIVQLSGSGVDGATPESGVGAGTPECGGAAAGYAVSGVLTDGRDHVGPYTQSELIARINSLAASGFPWEGMCQNFAAQAMGRPNSGYPTANDAWATFRAQGTAHPANAVDGRIIPVGAWVYFDTANWAGHVGVYVGLQNGVPMMASTDAAPDGSYRANALNIVPFKAIEGWGPYLGWAAPWGEKVSVVTAAANPVDRLQSDASTVSAEGVIFRDPVLGRRDSVHPHELIGA